MIINLLDILNIITNQNRLGTKYKQLIIQEKILIIMITILININLFKIMLKNLELVIYSDHKNQHHTDRKVL